MTRTRWLLVVAGLVLFLAAAWYYVGGPLMHSFADRMARLRERCVITVEAAYPGANASVVADTVAAPIEQQVAGVEGMLHVVSRSSNDGSYTLTVTFRPGSDLAIAQVLVQNRVSLALPVLPEVVKQVGVTTRRKAAGVLMLLAVSSPDDSRDGLFLGNYASTALKDELARVPGVGDAAAAGPEAFARLNGKSAAVLAISALPQANPREMSKTVGDLLSRIRPKLPAGVAVDVAFDFTPNLEAGDRAAGPEYFLIDPTFPADASPKRCLRMLEQSEKVLRDVRGVRDFLVLSGNPFDGVRDRPCVLVRLAPADKERPSREEIAKAVRTGLGEVKGLRARLRDLSGRFPRCGYPIDLALSGPEQDRVQEWADKLTRRLAASDRLADVWTNSESRPRPQMYVAVDRDKAKELGVSLEDVFTTLQVFFGAGVVNDFNRFGRVWQVHVQAQGPGRKAEDVKKLKVRNGQGEMVPLAALVMGCGRCRAPLSWSASTAGRWRRSPPTLPPGRPWPRPAPCARAWRRRGARSSCCRASTG